ncbi:MAG: DEAD/DEAH box helicase [Egibacteraceae bacterium]
MEKGKTISTSTQARPLSAQDFRRLAQAHVDGRASESDAEILDAHEDEWVDALEWLLRDADAALKRVRANVTGPERDLVIADFSDERERIASALTALTGDAPAPPAEEDERSARPVPDEPDAPSPPAPPAEPRVTRLQLSWTPGHVVAWAGGERAEGAAPHAGADAWAPHGPVRLPDGVSAESVAVPITAILGWLVALDGSSDDDALGVSAAWLGSAARLAVRLVAQGRMVPQLEKATRDGATATSGNGRGGRSPFAVRWVPALIDPDELGALSRSRPGAVAAPRNSGQDAKTFTEAVVGDFVDAICRDAAGRIEVPAAPPDPRSEQEVAEAVLALLDGSAFEAPEQHGAELRRGLRRWGKAVAGPAGIRLVVQLDPPDEGDAWYLRTLTGESGGKQSRVEAAMSNVSTGRRELIKRELDRLETLYPPLCRGKATRRGEVILSQEEAWELMTNAGTVLQAAGFEVRVPPLSRRKPSPGLRLTSLETQESVVGAQQLTTVRWSAVFDEVELTAGDITRLASEARPLIKAHGRWVELDHADLEAAAEALAQRADRTQLSGAEMLRHALGLDGPSLSGGISVAGRGWAADLITSAGKITEEPEPRPEGFAGELRAYQAEALAWLGFLADAGLGGCLALDMGLGKTPVMLAHLRAAAGDKPALVVAPPAVVGNWAAEARRFVPDLRVVVHHGARRTGQADLADEVAGADVLLTTYGTAVRDIDGLAAIDWSTLVLDEAQVIKNPASDTAQQLRRLDARTRVALTGTPIENGLGDLWALLDFTNPGLVGDRATFVAQLSRTAEGRSSAEQALRTLNGVLVFRRTKVEPIIAAELPDRIDVLDHCPMTPEQIGLYQAVLDDLVAEGADEDTPQRKGAVLAAITALKQICNHPAAYTDRESELAGRSGKLARLEGIVDSAFEAGERVLVFTHFASWGEQLAAHLSGRTGYAIDCYHGGLSRTARDRMVEQFQEGQGPGALVLSLKAGGTGLNLTAASHVVLYDRWWNPAVEDQARDRAWRIGQTKTVVCHRLVCPGTVDERVEEVVAGKRRIADLVLPESSSLGDLDSEQLRTALGLDPDEVLTEETLADDAEEVAA